MGNKIFEAINGVMADIGAIRKEDDNTYDKYKYRGIDAVYNAVQPALIKNGVFIVPNVVSMEQGDRASKKGDLQIHTKVNVEYTLYATDGSSITASFPGEAIDRSDKSINKAMTAAYKYMIFELFCIPTEDLNDADADSPEAGQKVVTNHDRLIEFCYRNGIDLGMVADRFGLDGKSTEEHFASALGVLLNEMTAKVV